jgi:hypothetical protein
VYSTGMTQTIWLFVCVRSNRTLHKIIKRKNGRH